MRLVPLPVPPALLAPAAATPTPNGPSRVEGCVGTATGHRLDAGVHALEFRVVDPTVVVQKLVVDTGGLGSSCPGSPESRRVH